MVQPSRYDSALGSPQRLDREPQPHSLGHGNQRGKPRVSASRQSAVQALALNAGSFGYLGNASSRHSDTAQGDQKHARLVVILQGGAEVFSGEIRIVAQFTNGFFVGYAGLAFHSG